MHTFRRVGVVALLAIVSLLPSARAADAQANGRGVLLAIDSRSGEVRWRATVPGSFAVSDVSPTTVIGRGFSCDTTDFHTIAFDATRGRRLWTMGASPDTPFGGTDSLATGSRRSGVALVLEQLRLSGVAARTGRPRWSTAFPYTPFVGANSSVVVSATTEGKYPDDHAVVRAVDRKTGEQLWTVTDDVTSRRAFFQLDSTSVVLDFETNDGRQVDVRVLDPRTGHVRWRTDQRSGYLAGSAVVFSMAGPDARTSARDATSGTELWSRPGDSAIKSYGSRLALLDEAGTTMVDVGTGTDLWSVKRPQRIVGDSRSLAIVDGRTVTLVDPDTGVPGRDPITLPDGYEVTNSVVLAGDTVYASLGCVSQD